MIDEKKISLGSVQETLLLPLWGRAVETKKQKPLLIDNKAVSIIENINYDFSIISERIGKLSQVSWIFRSISFDERIKEFIKTGMNISNMLRIMSLAHIKIG